MGNEGGDVVRRLMGELAAEGERADEAEARAAELERQIQEFQFQSAQRFRRSSYFPFLLSSRAQAGAYIGYGFITSHSEVAPGSINRRNVVVDRAAPGHLTTEKYPNTVLHGDVRTTLLDPGDGRRQAHTSYTYILYRRLTADCRLQARARGQPVFTYAWLPAAIARPPPA
jgi:hypothetical protein